MTKGDAGAECALEEGLILGGEDGTKLVLPVTAVGLGFVEDLEAEDMVGEAFARVVATSLFGRPG